MNRPGGEVGKLSGSLVALTTTTIRALPLASRTQGQPVSYALKRHLVTQNGCPVAALPMGCLRRCGQLLLAYSPFSYLRVVLLAPISVADTWVSGAD